MWKNAGMMEAVRSGDAMKNALDIYNAQHTDAPLELSMYLDFDDPAGNRFRWADHRKSGK